MSAGKLGLGSRLAKAKRRHRKSQAKAELPSEKASASVTPGEMQQWIKADRGVRRRFGVGRQWRKQLQGERKAVAA